MADIASHYVTQFSSNIELLLSQSGYRPRPYVRHGTHVGENASPVEQIGDIGLVYDRAMNSDTPSLGINNDRRWVRPRSLTTAHLVDRLDLQKMLIDPRSQYAVRMAETLGRGSDDFIGEAFFADAATGKTGSVATAFPNTQKVGVDVGGTASGLNVAKLRAAKKLLMASGLDLARNQAYIAITSQEHDDLLGELQVTSLDYNTKPTLVDGQVMQFMGFNFVHVEWQATVTPNGVSAAAYPLSLPYIAPGGLAATARFIPAWVEDGMYQGTWGGVVTRIDEREDKNYSTQLWAEMTAGATRLEEKKVVQIAVDN